MTETNTYTYAIIAGVIIYIIIETDKNYFSKNKDAAQYSSLRIAMLVTLLIWGILTYNQNETIIKPRDKFLDIRTDPYY